MPFASQPVFEILEHFDRPPDKSVHLQIIFFLFLNQNICFGFSKEPSQ